MIYRKFVLQEVTYKSSLDKKLGYNVTDSKDKYSVGKHGPRVKCMKRSISIGSVIVDSDKSFEDIYNDSDSIEKFDYSSKGKEKSETSRSECEVGRFVATAISVRFGKRIEKAFATDDTKIKNEIIDKIKEDYPSFRKEVEKNMFSIEKIEKVIEHELVKDEENKEKNPNAY